MSVLAVRLSRVLGARSRAREYVLPVRQLPDVNRVHATRTLAAMVERVPPPDSYAEQVLIRPAMSADGSTFERERRVKSVSSSPMGPSPDPALSEPFSSGLSLDEGHEALHVTHDAPEGESPGLDLR